LAHPAGHPTHDTALAVPFRRRGGRGRPVHDPPL